MFSVFRLASVFLLFAATGVLAQSGAERAKAAGELVTLKRHRVLRLSGESVRERGFAHGWLLATEVRESLDDALKSLPLFTAEKYEKQLVPWAEKRFAWDADAVDEMDGLFEGLRERLGEEGLVSASLGRALKREDLPAIVTIADWFGPSCSGFTAWDSLTAGGAVVHGRNLDFPIGPKAVANQVVLAVAALPARGERPARKAWIGVGWPGLCGVFSAMNADGLICCLHDANNVVKGGAKEGFVARGILLRRMIEAIDPAAGDPAEAAAKMAAERPVACGNLFHLSWPRAAAEKNKTTPAAVLEFDGNRDDPAKPGVAIRRMDGSKSLVLTNHYCVRCAAMDCTRFTRITEALAALTQGSKRLGVADARKVLVSGEHPAPLATATHTLVFLPDSMTVHVALTRGNVLSTRVADVPFSFQELFGK